jgi:hypothetical protein
MRKIKKKSLFKITFNHRDAVVKTKSSPMLESR